MNYMGLQARTLEAEQLILKKVKQMNYMQNTLLLKISILFQLFIEQI